MEEQQYHKYINNNQIQVFFSTWLHSAMVIVSIFSLLKYVYIDSILIIKNILI